jgi:hypothetical protein
VPTGSTINRPSVEDLRRRSRPFAGSGSGASGQKLRSVPTTVVEVALKARGNAAPMRALPSRAQSAPSPRWG